MSLRPSDVAQSRPSVVHYAVRPDPEPRTTNKGGFPVVFDLVSVVGSPQTPEGPLQKIRELCGRVPTSTTTEEGLNQRICLHPRDPGRVRRRKGDDTDLNENRFISCTTYRTVLDSRLALVRLVPVTRTHVFPHILPSTTRERT